MPNHITTIMEVTHHSCEETEEGNKELDRLIEEVKGEEDCQFIDFNKIIVPPSNLFHGDISLDKKKELDEQGIPNWYDWQSKNWGTKWNAYEQSFDGHTIWKFQTAWEHPFPVIEALSIKYPLLLFTVVWGDEGGGSGGYKMINGRLEAELEIKDSDQEDFINLAVRH